MQASRRTVPLHEIQAVWNAFPNFVPLKGQLLVYDADQTHKEVRYKFGDGKTAISQLPFAGTNALQFYLRTTLAGNLTLDCGYIPNQAQKEQQQ